jgi:hypothetical protein
MSHDDLGITTKSTNQKSKIFKSHFTMVYGKSIMSNTALISKTIVKEQEYATSSAT